MGLTRVASTVAAPCGAGPVVRRVDAPGAVTHAHLPESSTHGGTATALADARKLKDGKRVDVVDISDFVYRRGDLTEPGTAGRPPVVPEGGALTFRNLDASRNIFHTITACKSPCSAFTGIAYPLA